MSVRRGYTVLLLLSLLLLLLLLLLFLFGQRPSLICPRTFTILPSATSTTPSLHVRIWQDGDYHKVLIAPFALILYHSIMLSLVVNSTLIVLPGNTTQSLTSLSLQPVISVHSSLYADDNGFLNPSIITGINYRPDRLFLYNPVQVPTCSRINSWCRV